MDADDVIQAFHLSNGEDPILDAAFGEELGIYLEIPHRYFSESELTSIIEQLEKVRRAYREETNSRRIHLRMSILDVLPDTREEAITIKELAERTGVSRRTLDKVLSQMYAAKEINYQTMQDVRGRPMVYWKKDAKEKGNKVVRFPGVAAT